SPQASTSRSSSRDRETMARKEALLGRKVGMTQIFGDDGNHVPVTVVQAGPCTIVEIRSKQSHGYDALQLGFEPAKKNVSKPRAGHVKKANVTVARVLPEQNLILIRGAVPGANGSLVMVRKSIKTTKAQQQKAEKKK